MFWGKKHEEPKKMHLVKKNRLSINMKDGTILFWTVEDWKGIEKMVDVGSKIENTDTFHLLTSLSEMML